MFFVIRSIKDKTSRNNNFGNVNNFSGFGIILIYNIFLDCSDKNIRTGKKNLSLFVSTYEHRINCINLAPLMKT